MHVLIVEDDTRITSFLVKGLRAEGYVTTVAGSAEDGRRRMMELEEDLDLVLLDLGLPGEDGSELLRWSRSHNVSVPFIILTARAEVRDKVKGLDAGANDYVTKPFAFEELLARIRAILRASDQPTATELAIGDLRLDLLSKVAWRAGRRIELAPREWALLELFMRHPTQVLSRSQILSRVWDYSFDPGSNVVDVYVGYLRRKINVPGLPPLIQTVRGAGYRLAPP
ncbi:MAG: response regulator transcription factor [Actinomycetota bacterium]|nr:response regulator transcription factor [Actinomycetota bacterium]